MDYTKINSKIIDIWCKEGWVWGKPITHEEFLDAKKGKFSLYLTPTKKIPSSWLANIKGKKVLGLASGGGQQLPILTALGADCVLLDYSNEQCNSELLVAKREGYKIEVIEADMTKPLPFLDECFDLIIHPVSNCYVEKIEPIFKECYRVLKKDGLMIGGYDIGINYIVDEKEEMIVNSLPYNPLKNKKQLDECMKNNDGIQFSHTFAEQIKAQLMAGFELVDIYEDTNGEGRLHSLNIPSFVATMLKK